MRFFRERLGFALIACVAACDGCHRGSGSSSAVDLIDASPEERDQLAIAKLTDEALLARAQKSDNCGLFESVGCDDVNVVTVRCELAARAERDSTLFTQLLKDARGTDRKKRGAALRVIADSPKPDAVRAVHDALLDPDPGVSCGAGAYGVYFVTEDAPRISELAKTCDGAPTLTVTASAVAKGKPGAIVHVGASCEDMRNAAPLVLRLSPW